MGLSTRKRPQILNPFLNKRSSEAEIDKTRLLSKRERLLKEEDFDALARHGLPHELRDAKWNVVYSLPRDGASFHVFLEKVEKVRKTLIAIKTDRGIVLGGYVEECWKPQASFFGTGHSFLYTIRDMADPRQRDDSDCWGSPRAVIAVEQSDCGGSDAATIASTDGDEMNAFEIIVSGMLGCAMEHSSTSSTLLSLHHCCLADTWCSSATNQVLQDDMSTTSTSSSNDGDRTPSPNHPSSSLTSKQVRIYDWTGNNRYFQFCNASAQRIALGGGGNSRGFGLCIESDFLDGSSDQCDTFRNSPLGVDKVFKIIDMEVYGISSY